MDRSLRHYIALVEAKGRPAGGKAGKAAVPPSIHLEWGRSIIPKPENGKKWKLVGEPRLFDITSLDLHPDGMATASMAVQYDFEHGVEHDNKNPVAVCYVDGQPHLLDGYHRVTLAALKGQREILAQVKA